MLFEGGGLDTLEMIGFDGLDLTPLSQLFLIALLKGPNPEPVTSARQEVSDNALVGFASVDLSELLVSRHLDPYPVFQNIPHFLSEHVVSWARPLNLN